MKSEQKRQSTTSNGHTSRTTVKQTGIEVVDKIYSLEKEADGSPFGMGHYVPDIWNRVFLDERDRPHRLAMLVMADIWFRHRPRQSRQIKDSGDVVVTLSKGFSGDRYQFNRAEMASRLNASVDAISRALSYLVKLGVIKREHEDIDINHRGFRNIVFVTPVIDRLVALVRAEEEKVNKNHPNQKTDEKDQKTERHDVGNVAPMVPATSSPSTGLRCRDEAGDVAGMTQAVSRRSSEKSSASAVFSAEPKKSLEANNNKTTSAPRRAQALGGVVEDHGWAAPPPTIQKGQKRTPEERAKVVRFFVGKYYLQWHEQLPNMLPGEFEEMTLGIFQETQWRTWDTTGIIASTWLGAVDLEPEEGKTFDPGFYCKKCGNSLSLLANRDRKEKKLFIQHVAEEVEWDFGYDQDSLEAWWEDEMLERGVIKDPDKYYDVGGREIRDPFDTTWTGIRLALDKWTSSSQPDRKPEPEWFEDVIKRMNQEAGKPNNHKEDYDAVRQMLENHNLLPFSSIATEPRV